MGWWVGTEHGLERIKPRDIGLEVFEKLYSAFGTIKRQRHKPIFMVIARNKTTTMGQRATKELPGLNIIEDDIVRLEEMRQALDDDVVCDDDTTTTKKASNIEGTKTEARLRRYISKLEELESKLSELKRLSMSNEEYTANESNRKSIDRAMKARDRFSAYREKLEHYEQKLRQKILRRQEGHDETTTNNNANNNATRQQNQISSLSPYREKLDYFEQKLRQKILGQEEQDETTTNTNKQRNQIPALSMVLFLVIILGILGIVTAIKSRTFQTKTAEELADEEDLFTFIGASAVAAQKNRKKQQTEHFLSVAITAVAASNRQPKQHYVFFKDPLLRNSGTAHFVKRKQKASDAKAVAIYNNQKSINIHHRRRNIFRGVFRNIRHHLVALLSHSSAPLLLSVPVVMISSALTMVPLYIKLAAVWIGTTGVFLYHHFNEDKTDNVDY